MKKEKKTRNKILKVCLLIICSIFIAGASQVTSVQAASDATMKKAYQKFVTSHKKSIKYYAYVNIGPNNKPVLLTATDPASSTIYGITNCKVYYYVNKNVKYLSDFGGMHALSLKRYKGQYYISSGTSSNMNVARVYNNKLDITDYHNSKNTNYKTVKDVCQGSGYKYTDYVLSSGAYRKNVAAYQNIKEINFSKIKSSPAKLNTTNLKMTIWDTKQLKVVGGSSTSVKWTSSNKSVVTVGQKNGVVYARKTGKATITARVSGKKLTCKVTVSKIAPGAMKYLKGKWSNITHDSHGPLYTAMIDANKITFKYRNGKTAKYTIHAIRRTSYGYFIYFKTSDGRKGGYHYSIGGSGVKSLPLVAGWNPYSTNMSYASGLEK